MSSRKPHSSDVSDHDWALVALYVTLLPEAARQREHSLREVFNGLCSVMKTGALGAGCLTFCRHWARAQSQRKVSKALAGAAVSRQALGWEPVRQRGGNAGRSEVAIGQAALGGICAGSASGIGVISWAMPLNCM